MDEQEDPPVRIIPDLLGYVAEQLTEERNASAKEQRQLQARDRPPAEVEQEIQKGRNLSLAITAVEDAEMRYARAHGG